MDNPKADRVRKLADLLTKRGLRKAGKFLVEGPQSVREVADLLERAVSGNLKVPQVPEPAPEPPANSPWRQPMCIDALVSVVVALASLAFACCVWHRFLRGQ